MSATPRDLVEIRAGNTMAWIAPACGGMAVRLRVGDRDVLHRAGDWAEAFPRRIHFGNPALFPIASYLERNGVRDRFEAGGEAYRLPQHGFARVLPWRVAAAGAVAVACELRSTPVTRCMWPWEFTARQEFEVADGRLAFRFSVTNESEAPMPFHFGWHPYLALPGPREAFRVRTPNADAARLFTNPEDDPAPPAGGMLALHESLARTRMFHGVERGVFELVRVNGGVEARVEADADDFPVWAVWSPGVDAPFVCVEPWTAAPNALNSGEGLRWVAPGASRSVGMVVGGPGN